MKLIETRYVLATRAKIEDISLNEGGDETC